MADDLDVSLRPVTLKPGGVPANPFASFGKGAGFGIKAKKAAAPVVAVEESAPKKEGRRVKYTKEFLMQFMERYTKCPVEVQQLGLPEIVISEESERDQQRQVLQKVAEEIDDRDWRTRDAAAATSSPAKSAAPQSAAPAAAGRDASWDKGKETAPAAQPKPQAPASQQQQQQQQQQQPAAAAPSSNEAHTKMAKAADVGLQAYKPGMTLTAEERAVRTIKGVLNKLTPEKFERLLQQLLEVITTSDILKQTIRLVFENAVEQPTYCAMYADLCLHLSKELPSFPPPAGADKPITFRQILLNTCQDEFEGTEAAREALVNMPEQAEREQAERAVKKRTMGNMRLISELYKQDMVKDWIMTTCMEELLAAPKGKIPPEDNIEAACEMITTAGGRLAKSDRPETRKKADDVLKALEKLGTDSRLPVRIRFVIRDILDLRRSNWVPRREVFTAKKLDDIRSQAEAELGMISSTIAAALPTLPTQQRLGMGLGIGGVGEESPLIPPLRSNNQDAQEWGLFPPLRGQAGMGGGALGGAGKASALIGDVPTGGAALQGATEEGAAPRPSAPTPAAAAAALAPAAAAAPAPGGGSDDEELARKVKSLLEEYLSTLDKKEAVTCVRELKAAAAMSKVVEMDLDLLLNAMREKDEVALVDLLIHLHSTGDVSSSHLVSGLSTYTQQLEDLSMDFPKAAKQLGQFIGQCVAKGALSLDVLPSLLEGDFSVEPKRDLAAAAFSAVQAANGADGLAAACKSAGLQAGAFLQADAELDPDAPSVEEWLKSENLSAVPV